jgi:thiopurine S-methyltransferase
MFNDSENRIMTKDDGRQYWAGRWKRGETGWHQTEVEPGLTSNFSKFSPTRVFVPLCGKSLDLVWLASQGHEVIGVEFTEQGILEFFEENQIQYQLSTRGKFKVFQGGRFTILNGDFFDLEASDLGSIGAVYDRAALIALPLETRRRYASKMIQLLKQCAHRDSFSFLQIVLERTPSDDKGPPYSVSNSEIRDLYGKAFQIQPISREALPMESGSSSQTEECVYLFK